MVDRAVRVRLVQYDVSIRQPPVHRESCPRVVVVEHRRLQFRQGLSNHLDDLVSHDFAISLGLVRHFLGDRRPEVSIGHRHVLARQGGCRMGMRGVQKQRFRRQAELLGRLLRHLAPQLPGNSNQVQGHDDHPGARGILDRQRLGENRNRNSSARGRSFRKTGQPNRPFRSEVDCRDPYLPGRRHRRGLPPRGLDGNEREKREQGGLAAPRENQGGWLHRGEGRPGSTTASPSSRRVWAVKLTWRTLELGG